MDDHGRPRMVDVGEKADTKRMRMPGGAYI
jgi:molybdenum cofactor biosynthesis enzyme